MSEAIHKTAIVTGGAKGIGKAICFTLAEAGYKIAFTYNSSKESADELAGMLTEISGSAFHDKCDVSVDEQVKAFVDKAREALGSVDLLVNNAGITKDGLLLRMSEADFESVIDVNLKGTFLFTKYASKYMLKQKQGKIINITSIIGLIGNAGQANYAASKAGIIGFTKSCAKELGGKGITVNAIAPGFIETDMTAALPEQMKTKMLEATALKRFGTPQDVANVVKFLASHEADYITGQVISVDGCLANY